MHPFKETSYLSFQKFSKLILRLLHRKWKGLNILRGEGAARGRNNTSQCE